MVKENFLNLPSEVPSFFILCEKNSDTALFLFTKKSMCFRGVFIRKQRKPKSLSWQRILAFLFYEDFRCYVFLWRQPSQFPLRNQGNEKQCFLKGKLWTEPKKLDNIFKLKLFKKPEGLVVCKLQVASPLTLLWFDGYYNNPNIPPVPAWNVP